MAIVQAGKQFTAGSTKETAGNLATHLRDFLHLSMNFKSQLESFVDADLVTLGLTQAEVDAIKGFFIGDMPSINAAFAASAWVRKLLGSGV